MATGPGARFSKAPETFWARKAKAKFPTLPLQGCFIRIFLIWTEITFIQEVSSVYTSPVLDPDEFIIPLRARKFSGVFEKRAQPGKPRSRFRGAGIPAKRAKIFLT